MITSSDVNPLGAYHTNWSNSYYSYYKKINLTLKLTPAILNDFVSFTFTSLTHLQPWAKYLEQDIKIE